MEGLRRHPGADSALRRCHLCRYHVSIPDVILMPNLPTSLLGNPSRRLVCSHSVRRAKSMRTHA